MDGKATRPSGWSTKAWVSWDTNDHLSEMRDGECRYGTSWRNSSPARKRSRGYGTSGASAIVLDNESKERALVGEVISTVALAGQICREFNVSDHGIDMEIEFKDDRGKATGRKLYLQLKSGDSYLRERKSDGGGGVHYQRRTPRPLLDGTSVSGAARNP